MANTFRSSIGAYRANAMQDAMTALGGGSSFDSVTQGGVASNLESRQRALEKANAWSERGVAAVGGFGDHMGEMQNQAMSQGMNFATNASINKTNLEAAEAQAAAQNKSGTFGMIAQGVGLGLSLLCERRLKTDIAALNPDNAWSLVRDLPLYSFQYKAAPGPTVYGPMIDEVETIDPSLVRPTLLPDDQDGPVRGFDVMRHQAYESIALQQALQRIEQLESRLAALEAPASAPAVFSRSVVLAA
jgi:hypothetical protein